LSLATIFRAWQAYESGFAYLCRAIFLPREPDPFWQNLRLEKIPSRIVFIRNQTVKGRLEAQQEYDCRVIPHGDARFTQYAINGLGQRVVKATTTAGLMGGANTVNAVYFIYDEAGNLIGEYDGTGTVIQETVWLDDLPVGVLQPGALYNVNPDHLGAPLTVTNATGQIV